MKKKKIVIKDCMTCEHCLPIGEGDHFCDKINQLVIEEYIPNDNYAGCVQKKLGGKKEWN